MTDRELAEEHAALVAIIDEAGRAIERGECIERIDTERFDRRVVDALSRDLRRVEERRARLIVNRREQT